MADQGLVNETPFAAQECFLTDEEARDLLVVVVRATYALRAGMPLALLEEQQQPPVALEGTYNGEPGTSSYRYEPQIAPVKPATDVVLLGHAYAPRYGVPHVDVALQLGPIRKMVRVFGNRRWYRRMGFEAISEPEPFEKIPLVFERAFGGWDRTPEDPEHHTMEARNPVGVGYHHKRYSQFVEGAPLPNLEDPRQLISAYTDAPPPMGFGFTGPEWAPRVSYVGTYDEAWMKHRMPRLPEDFDRRFYNAAPPDQIVNGYVHGNEPVVVVGTVLQGVVQFALPGEPPPHCVVAMKGHELQTLPARLDTVVIDTDAQHVALFWRAHYLVPDGRLHDVRAIRIEPDPASVHAQPADVVVPVS